MMLLLALLVFFASTTLFNAGGSVPETGLGEVQQAPAAHSTAQLMIKRVIPMAVVAGTGFRSGELVRLTGVPVKRVRASAKGTFTIRFRHRSLPQLFDHGDRLQGEPRLRELLAVQLRRSRRDGRAARRRPLCGVAGRRGLGQLERPGAEAVRRHVHDAVVLVDLQVRNVGRGQAWQCRRPTGVRDPSASTTPKSRPGVEDALLARPARSMPTGRSPRACGPEPSRT